MRVGVGDVIAGSGPLRGGGVGAGTWVVRPNGRGASAGRMGPGPATDTAERELGAIMPARIGPNG